MCVFASETRSHQRNNRVWGFQWNETGSQVAQLCQSILVENENVDTLVSGTCLQQVIKDWTWMELHVKTTLTRGSSKEFLEACISVAFHIRYTSEIRKASSNNYATQAALPAPATQRASWNYRSRFSTCQFIPKHRLVLRRLTVAVLVLSYSQHALALGVPEWARAKTRVPEHSARVPGTTVSVVQILVQSWP